MSGIGQDAKPSIRMSPVWSKTYCHVRLERYPGERYPVMGATNA